ncbi:CLUMA_CG010877, isoform A [Clunio marinus]|uniref:CLUMA_CG010877, isoform A n=1 Tax=Clunio marinus TaxID=568069 RepID=A0A1J1IB81_9DIPT|nr:CLUMA_CG010877, isoform A [Clunio marinus]
MNNENNMNSAYTDNNAFKHSKNSLISITRSNVSLVTTNALPTVEISSDKSNSFTTSAGTIQTTGNTPNNVPELTTENLSLTNKSLLSNRLVSESLTSSSVIVKSNSSNYHSVSNSTQNFKSTNKQRTNSNSLIKVSASGGIRISGQKIEMPHLNDFFDHSDYLKKHEHGFRYGPHFETGNVTNITVQVGNTFYLHCKISLLQDKTVSWVRRKSGENGLELLTVGKQTYSGDPRYSVDFQYPNNWRLKIASAQKIDEATYECQISTSPPRFIHYNVRVNAPTIRIVDEQGISLLDKYYEVDSTIRLTCIVRHISMMSSVVYWIHNNFTILNYDVIRGGISVKTDLMEIGANSTLLVAKVNKTDSGNYTCSIGESQQYTVLVHVLNESLAELHHSGCSSHHIETTGKLHYLNFVMIALFLSTLNQFILCINR